MTRKNNGIGIVILLLALSIGLLGSTGWLMAKSKGQKEILKDTQEELQTAEAAKANLGATRCNVKSIA